MGIHTVLDLRAEGGRATLEGKLVRSLGMQYVNVPLAGYQAPTQQQITTALGILQDSTLAPVVVHCRRGADRTGTIVALYRIVHDHWTNQQALDEARRMRMASRETLMEQLILQYHPQPSYDQGLRERNAWNERESARLLPGENRCRY
jgi:protein-tyrosine phosphatase